MRRLAPHLFTLVSAASLLLCAAVCVLWARSYWPGDHVVWYDPKQGPFCGVLSARGNAVVYYVAGWAGSPWLPPRQSDKLQRKTTPWA
jgi:hypothetical protein